MTGKKLINITTNAYRFDDHNFFTDEECLKQELIYHRRFSIDVEAKAAIQEYIEVFYSKRNRHSSIRNIAPVRIAESWILKKEIA